MKKKIFLVTSSRADYDHLYWLMKNLIKIDRFKLTLLVTGNHMEKKFGNTISKIKVENKIKLLKLKISFKEDSKNSISKSLANIISKSSICFDKHKPNLIILLGDRFEILGCAIGASINNIPLAHLNGGEVTAGAIDEWSRHSITKMSNFHFVANKVYKKRVIQLGEDPKKVFCTGGLSADNVKKTKILKKNILESKLGKNLLKKNILITYHPETLEKKKSSYLFANILKALEKLNDVGLFFTSPNADPDNSVITKMINNFVKKNKNAYFFLNLGRQKYLSLMRHCNIILGNSSSGLLEAPYLGTYTINIGDRQLGRLKSNTIYDVKNERNKINILINKLISKKKHKIIKLMYGRGNAAKNITDIIRKIDFDSINLKKKFYDL